MERFVKITEERDIELDGEPWADMQSTEGPHKLAAACALYDSLIRPAGLERSGREVQAVLIKPGEWCWLPDIEQWAIKQHYTDYVAFFLLLYASGGIRSHAVGFSYKVELPRTAEEKGEAEVLTLVCPNCEQNTLPGFAYEDPKPVSVCTNCSYKAELNPDDVPGLNPPESQKTAMELLEERVMVLEKWQDDEDTRAMEASEY